MSYTFTTGQVAQGASLSINTGTTSTPIWTPIAQVMNAEQAGKVIKTVNATNLQSTVAEILPTIPDSGHYKCSAIRVPSDAGQAAVLTAFNLGAGQAPVQFQLQLPKDAAAAQTVAGDKSVFTGYIVECEDIQSVSPEKIIMFEFTIKVQTAYTLTPGS